MPSTPAFANVLLRPGVAFNGLKVFSATMFQDRSVLGEKVTAWLEANSRAQVTEMAVTQSSDAAFHCVTIIVFYRAAA